MSALGVPRRWSEDVDGIRWLPRLIDKARMSSGGELAAYLFGHSPIDRGLMTGLGVTTATFAAIVADSPDDAAVLTALRARGFDEARVRRWSARLPKPYQIIITMIDLDEGHTRPTRFERAWIGAFRTIEGGVMGLVRLVSPAP
ncbi:MAG TPA: DUF5069 domain-containing protein [Candidatus Eremiobacteraceae bacterium]